VFFPVGDDNSRRTRVPYVTLGLVALNVIVFLAELFANSQGGLEALVRQWSVIPADYARGAGIGGPVPWTIVTSMFLHGGWMHLGGNMLYLWIFGDNLEDVMGRARYLVFYLLCGIAATAAQIWADPKSEIPNLGASGAIAGVLGGYLVLFPKQRVRVLLGRSIVHMPALFVLGLWIVLQLVGSWGQIAATRQTGEGGVAYMAHVGGFVAGLVLVWIFRRRQPALAARAGRDWAGRPSY
jgi:membrane associated rhomboid family serine protease